MGTKLDALLVDQTAYYKVAGPLAISLNASADKWTKVAIPNARQPGGDVTDARRPSPSIQDALAKLPAPP